MNTDFEQTKLTNPSFFDTAGKDLTNVQNLQKKHQALMVNPLKNSNLVNI